jgi:N6-L-threonylcarbamoyladenine synthase
MNILAIETSCDETAICYLSVSESDSGNTFTVQENITHTQLEHIEYGGIFPAIAKREHTINLPIILEKIMQDREIPDYICVTNGPGLEPALWCGITFAQELSKKWSASRRIPVIPVNHMEGHILSVLVPESPSLDKGRDGAGFVFTIPEELFPLPALALLISGGHTELVLVKNIGEYSIIGKTRDDAVGEAFDKVARILGLPYPGGPEIAKLADMYSAPSLDKGRDGVGFVERAKTITLPRPMMHSQDYDFSFSGLKTAVLYTVRDIKAVHNDVIPEHIAQEIAHEFQESASEVITKKTCDALRDFSAQTLIVGGGVSANNRIKESLQAKAEAMIAPENIHFPIRELTGDNALMIAIAGYYKYKKSPDTVYDDIKAVGNLSF